LGQKQGITFERECVCGNLIGEGIFHLFNLCG
jgi:hypothetical protein